MGRPQDVTNNTEDEEVSVNNQESDPDLGEHNGTLGGKNQLPEISLEWSDVKVSFRIVPEFDFENNDLHKQHYELFPKLDSLAPSAKNIAYLKRKANKEKNNGSTLSSLLGYPLPQPTPTAPKVKPSPQNTPDVSAKLNTSAGTLLMNDSRNSIANATPTIRRASTGEGGKQGLENSDGPNKCHLCGKGFNKATYLKRHILSHSSVKPYKCDICNWGFFQQCNLKRHMASHSVENGAQGFKCEHCSATFTTKSVLSVHLREAHGDKLVTKKEAQKAANASDRNNTSGVDNLQQMIMKGPKVSRGFPQRISVGRGKVTRTIRGSFGGVVFRNKSLPQTSSPISAHSSSANSSPDTLTIKKVTKTGISANGWSRCHICNKKFLTPTNLKQHMLLHQGVKPFRCNFCGLRFTQKMNLKKHVQMSHVSGAGHPCPHCNMNFRAREDVAHHILKQHPGQAISAVTKRSQPSTSITNLSRHDLNQQPDTRDESNASLNEMTTEPEHENENNQDLDKEEEEEQIDDVEEEEIMDDEEEVEIPSPEDGSPGHFVIQGKPVISSPPQMVGGALPRLPPLPRAGLVSPSNKTVGSSIAIGAYNCTICMESFSKVGLLNKHIISMHSSGATLTPTVQGSNLNR